LQLRERGKLPKSLKFVQPGGDFSTASDEEVRLNRSAYEFIVDKRLFDRTHMEEMVKAGVRTVDFPLAAKEVKAHWVKIEESDKPRYHWAKSTSGNLQQLYGLVALHIITRGLPRWHWSTFEHIDNKGRWAQSFPSGMGDDAFAGWTTPSKDSFACPEEADCDKVPTGLGLEGTKWSNYRLRGTQIDWVTDRGESTRLVNSKIEGGLDQNTMSCMTCHALAVAGDNPAGSTMPISIVQLNPDGSPRLGPTRHMMGYIGVPSPAWFKPDPSRIKHEAYMDLDFVWSLRNAQRRE
jgi:hypothetical protein